MKYYSVFGLLALCLTLTACDDFTSPQGVLGTAATKLGKNDLKGLKKTLIGNAFQEYGSEDGMVKLQASVSNKKLGLGKPQSLETGGPWWNRFEIFDLQVLDESNPKNPQLILTAQITCRYQRRPAGHGRRIPITTCKISEISL